MKISLLIPCYNEEKSIRGSIESWLNQSRPADEIIVVNDSSTDGTLSILKEYEGKIKIVTTHKNMSNKSHAQEYGLKFVTGDIFVATDADTILDHRFIEEISKCFNDVSVDAAGGYIKSIKNNWLTACRAFEYCISQNIHKLAQSYIDSMFVIPGAAGAFRTNIFKKFLTFDHDTITEDLDFTYKLHELNLRIAYNTKAIVFTQDPFSLGAYINQIRRWFGGGFQNLKKHYMTLGEPYRALEWSLIYAEGIIFSFASLLLPFISIYLSLYFIALYFLVLIPLSVFASIKEKRSDLMFIPFSYTFLMYINSWIFLEQFIKVILFNKVNLIWFKPERAKI